MTIISLYKLSSPSQEAIKARQEAIDKIKKEMGNKYLLSKCLPRVR